jgi:carbon-monoxide dehydrogenase medium subunit
MGETKAYPMTNTHLLVHEFDLCEPSSLQEALALLAKYGDCARLMAAGTHLLVEMKQEHTTPELVINIAKLSDLKGASRQDGGLAIGALTTIRETHDTPAVSSHYQALAEACAAFGSMQIQMVGTLGGNVCNGSPASDTVPALLAFDAQLKLVGPQGERIIPLREYLLGPGETALGQGEILTHVLLPQPTLGTGSAFIKLTRVAADLAKASAAAVIVRDGDTIIDCRIAFGSVAPTVFRAAKAEAFLRGKQFSPELALEAGEIAMDEVSPIDDVRSTAWYRRQVVKAITHDILVAAWNRATGVLPALDEVPTERTKSSKGEATLLLLGRDERVLVELTVNGAHHQLWVAPNDLLLNVLREKLELTGPKYGCGIGECGACTVLLNGRPALSCLVLAATADGADVVTVEGLSAADGTLHPLQDAFLGHQAFQCGYCTPGILMMSKTLLDDLASPSEDDVREYLRGNRCRCTGFTSITRAVLSQVNTGTTDKEG